jgi:cytochrome c oxidase cbb3-type subunit IV
MLKFIKGHIASISGIEIYPLISLAIFFGFFVILAIYLSYKKNEYYDKMSAFPLDKND